MAGKRERERRKINYGDAKESAAKRADGNDSKSIRVPDGIPFFSIKAAKSVKIDILPYEVKKGKETKGGNPFAPAGVVYYERTYYCHRGIGAEQTTVICPRKTAGKKCPICEDQQKMRRDPDADEKAIKDLEPKQRQLFIVHDHAEPDVPFKLWDYSYHLFGKMLDAKIQGAEPDDDYEGFYHLEGGKTLRIGFAEESMGSHAFFKCNNIEMKPRAKDLPESLLDEVPDLDSLLVEMDYDSLKKYYFQEEDEDDAEVNGVDEDGEPVVAKKSTGRPKKEFDEDEDEDDEPAKKPAAKKAAPPAKKAALKDDEDEDDDQDEDEDTDDEDFKVGDTVEHEEFGTCTVVKLIDGGKKLDLKDEDGKVKKAVFASDVTPAEADSDDEDEDDDPPAKKPAGKTPAKKVVDEDDDDEDDWDTDDDDDDDDDDEPAPKKRGRPAKK